jgi:hypothetical protein
VTNEEFWFRVNKTESCWLWTGSVGSHGYGDLRNEDGEHVLAHRHAWVLLVGSLSVLDLLHHKDFCHNSLCVRPDHVEKSNRRDHPDACTSINAKKTNCKYGHEFTPENTYKPLYRGRGGVRVGRRCRECHRLDQQRRRRNERGNSSARTTI